MKYTNREIIKGKRKGNNKQFTKCRDASIAYGKKVKTKANGG